MKWLVIRPNSCQVPLGRQRWRLPMRRLRGWLQHDAGGGVASRPAPSGSGAADVLRALAFLWVCCTCLEGLLGWEFWLQNVENNPVLLSFLVVFKIHPIELVLSLMFYSTVYLWDSFGMFWYVLIMEGYLKWLLILDGWLLMLSNPPFQRIR